jgi:hypothetical protein
MTEESEKQSPSEVRFTPSPELWKYLGWLARNTVLGRTENDVAKQVLAAKLSEMRKEDYKDPQKT